MSDSEEESFSFYGTPLEPYDEDAFPKKKPISVEEQVARDAQGRRRFHGAFTGGFSAGFFNTVGSLEGWTPSEFKSSRNEKAKNVKQKPVDFMDDEDLSEFGIAPQVIQATKDYSQSNKRKKDVFSSGPIPGQPVLQSLIESTNETIGYYILKNMTMKQKKEIKQQMETNSSQKVYGCEMPKNIENVEEIFKETYDLPDIYKQYLSQSKSNSAGLGYSGLIGTSESVTSRSQLTMKDRNNKKVSISGQAFGVGAFENEDEDIYSKDDMTKYDFELTSEKHEAKTRTYSSDVFVQSKIRLQFANNFPSPIIPSSFTGKHNVRKSRFEPLPVDKEKKEESLPKRKGIDATLRAKYLGEDVSDVEYTSSSTQHKVKENSHDIPHQQPEQEPSGQSNLNETNPLKQFTEPNLLSDKFVSASKSDDHTDILKSVSKTESVYGTKEMYDAARMKMFGPLTRKTFTWQPSSLLCKRFNVPETKIRDDNSIQSKKRSKNLIFEYQKHSETELLHSPGLSTSSSFTEKQSDETTVIKTENELEKVLPSEPKNNTSTLEDEVVEVIKEAVSIIVDYTEKIDLSKQADLFKAVFLSSSESEDEDSNETEQQKRNEEIKENVLNDHLLPKIKSTKEGILSNIDFSSINKGRDLAYSEIDSTEKDNETLNKGMSSNVLNSEVSQDKNVDTENTYGPKLPEKITAHHSSMEMANVSLNSDSDEWVEKDNKHKKHKHKKKRKKEKHRDKHRSKSKSKG